jgi:heme-degrading monooxygenase HmoA
MPKLVEMDPYITLFSQMEQPVDGPIVLLNVFTVAPDEADQLIDVWARDAAIMKRQPGFISAQFHRGVGGTAFLNYAIWESMVDFKRAFLNPEFQAAMSTYPQSTVASPHIFQKLAVPGICVD